MSQGTTCRCAESKKPIADRNWGVSQRNQRCSAFDGYHPKWSEYSAVRCMSCRAVWRTKAAFVTQLRSIYFRNGDYTFDKPSDEKHKPTASPLAREIVAKLREHCRIDRWPENSAALVDSLLESLVNDRDTLAMALRKVRDHYNDLSKSNPGFMGKLTLQNYALWNEALLLMEQANPILNRIKPKIKTP